MMYTIVALGCVWIDDCLHKPKVAPTGKIDSRIN
jgi:hypothetical protein